MKRTTILTAILITMGVVLSYGCSLNSTESTKSSPISPAQDEATERETMQDHGEHMHGNQSQPMQMTSGQSGMEEMEAGLSNLSPEDRAAAEKQHICPVSGKMLGTMGTPRQVKIDDRRIWLCCPGCEGQLRDDPEKYLAKLEERALPEQGEQ